MNILSYRGPSAPGGVSATLSRVIERSTNEQQWWFLHGTALRKKGKRNANQEVCQIPFEIIEGHYRYCNEFLWPLLHELPQYASFDESNRLMYQQLNMSYACNVLHSDETEAHQSIFINDYQLALCPKFFNSSSYGAVDLFWHIPWPKTVEEQFVPYLAEIAVGLLYAGKIGFHIEEYATNFLQFVKSHLPEYKADFAAREVMRGDGFAVKVVFHPLGVDSDYWMSKFRDESFVCRNVNIRSLDKRPFVLSVDRADYTKGVYERLLAIEYFFSSNPDQIGAVTFVQVCQKTRAGLPGFDEYWEQCRCLFDSMNARWASKDWAPIEWIDEPVSANVLAWLYKRASAMLITPLYDGLNLTAKEFALCSEGGALILSSRAGAWHELSDNVLTLEDLRPESIAEKICDALAMERKERRERLCRLREAVLGNTLALWWQNFGGNLRIAERVLPLTVKVHHSTRRKAWSAN
jgi:trehalose-6-phosphate synthase